MGDLVLLPWRVGLRAARCLLDMATSVTERAFGAATRVVEAASPASRPTTAASRPTTAPPARSTTAPASRPTAPTPKPARAAGTRRPVQRRPATPPPPPRAAPAHVTEQPALVREEAEPGAEDGAGATVTVLEPWPGYRQMTAGQIVARIGDANAATLAAIELYEGANRRRQSVMSAVTRALRRAQIVSPGPENGA